MPRPRDVFSIVAPAFKSEPDSYVDDMAATVLSQKEMMPGNLHLVTSRSPRRYKGVVETLAWYFKREFRYDFPGYTADEDTSDSEVRSFFWSADDLYYPRSKGHRVIGACTFRRRKWKNLPDTYWLLGWIWMHPFCRRHGLLTSAWPFFTAMFEPLDVEYPISEPMREFLSDKPHQTVYTTDEHQEVKLYTYSGRETLEMINV